MIHICYFVSYGMQKCVLFETVRSATEFLQTIKPQQLNSITMKNGPCYRNKTGYYLFLENEEKNFLTIRSLPVIIEEHALLAQLDRATVF